MRAIAKALNVSVTSQLADEQVVCFLFSFEFQYFTD